MRLIAFVVVALCSVISLRAQETTLERNRDEGRMPGWSNAADLSFVVTSGNSSTSALALDDKLVRIWQDSEFSLRLGALRTRTADDRFAIGTMDDFRIVEDTSKELDNERYYASGRFDRDIAKGFFWVTGAGWDRDKNAGIEHRTVVFGGVGNTWRDDENTRFKTDYTITFTRRVDAIEDPERNERFSEARLSSDYMKQFAANAQFDSDFVFFVDVSNASDYRFNTLNSVTSSLSERMALRFSLQFVYQNFPALEEIALFDVDPTLGGVGIGSAVVRKRTLDTVVKFSLVFTL